ncbi:MAG: helix-turn-helix transcriptional regulator [Rhizobiales bacterium]|nr:helix-turn-helix transcriptional regulator [Hyphomicrobiales bacterium]
MAEKGYPLFCPIAMASAIIEPRWTLLVLCEMWTGSTRFSQIQRGVPGMSPALLSKRLKELEAKGLIRRGKAGTNGSAEYFTTPLADDLEPIIRRLGEWAQANVDSTVSLSRLDARLLMWNIRRKIDRVELPLRDCVIQFTLKDRPKGDLNYWLVVKPGLEPDLCNTDLGFNVDLFIVAELRSLTSAWMGHSTFEAELDSGSITLIGDRRLAASLTRWLVRSRFAEIPRCAADAATHPGRLSLPPGRAARQAAVSAPHRRSAS